MKELVTPSWLIGSAMSLGGAVIYRLGYRWFSERPLVVAQLLGLAGIALGLFVIARGVSLNAARRASQSSDKASG